MAILGQNPIDWVKHGWFLSQLENLSKKWSFLHKKWCFSASTSRLLRLRRLHPVRPCTGPVQWLQSDCPKPPRSCSFPSWSFSERGCHGHEQLSYGRMPRHLSLQNTTSWWTMTSCQTKLFHLNPWYLPCTSSPSSAETSASCAQWRHLQVG